MTVYEAAVRMAHAEYRITVIHLPSLNVFTANLLVRERSALATLIFFTLRVCLSVIRSVILSFCLSVRKFGAKYLGNEAR